MALEVVAASMPVDSEQRSCCGLSGVFNHAFQIANADWNRVVFLATSNFFLDLDRSLDRRQLVVSSIMATSSLVESIEHHILNDVVGGNRLRPLTERPVTPVWCGVPKSRGKH